MKMYRWKSEYLKNYGSGDIIVCAPSVEYARELASAEFEKKYKERYLWMYQDDLLSFLEKDPEEKEYYLEREEIFKNDISADPEIMEVIFIEGSE